MAELAVPDRTPGPAAAGLEGLRAAHANPARRVDDRPWRLRVRHRRGRPPAPGIQLQSRPGHREHEVVVRRAADRCRAAAAGTHMRRPGPAAITALALPSP